MSNDEDDYSDSVASSSSSSTTSQHKMQALEMEVASSSKNSFDMEEEEFDEAIGLLGSGVRSYNHYEDSTPQGRNNSKNAWIWWIVTILFVLGLSALFQNAEENEEGSYSHHSHSSFSTPPKIQCIAASDNDDDTNEIVEEKNHIVWNPNNLRSAKYHPWSKTYDQVKAKIQDWKAKQFIPYLQNGDSIFESGCAGNGMNLYITLSIVKKNGGLTDLNVYGNAQAQQEMDETLALVKDHPILPKHQATTICTGNPMMLTEYIPDESFDLVFTGFVDVMWVMENDNDDESLSLLQSSNVETTCAQTTRADKLQTRTEQIYKQWVSEMIRVAKPGARIVVENVSPPLCSADWEEQNNSNQAGGVSPEWWHTAIQNDDFSIDETSLSFVNSQLFVKDYHVAMTKKAK